MSSVKIHQIYYRPTQLSYLEPEFQPYYNPLNTSERQLFEYSVFRKEYDLGKIQGLTGYVSWKFRQKTNLTGSEVIKFIHDNPGFDVYTFNPFFELSELFPNVWWQGEAHHPGIISLAQKIYEEIGVSVNLSDLRSTDRSLLYCNYWVGSRSFWDRYMQHMKEIVHVIHSGDKEKFPNLYADSGYHDGSTYIPFILERVFSTFIEMNKDISVCPYLYSEKQKAAIVALLRESAEREFDSLMSPPSFLKRLRRFAFDGGYKTYNWKKWF